MKNLIKEKRRIRAARSRRVRAKSFGTPERPRLSVFRSHNHIYAQLIDDVMGKTLGATSDLNLDKTAKPLPKSEQAVVVGTKIAEIAKEQNVKKVVFDRGPFAYHGRIKILADAARKAGLEF